MSYNGKVYRKQGGDELAVADGGKITDDGTQAIHIDDIATDANGTAIAAAVNAILAALEGVGILADS